MHEELQRQAAGLTRTSKHGTTIQDPDAEELPGGLGGPLLAISPLTVTLRTDPRRHGRLSVC